ncbi:inter-alpha-trypsin inhibitor heavy chain H4-like [Diabrotica undecimpunctata]|uniref:inter-alpha-trypsin inhibitor heavy chain H4-like n=1 Tax=Diabrotica undecimpunctata TaxID=50387 RepID=UPI003B639695
MHNEQPTAKELDETNIVPVIYELNVHSNVTNRYAKTLITNRVKNPAKSAKETTFSVVLPEKAFISEFVMEIGWNKYKAYVKEKEEAKKIYTKAVASGQSAAHVAVNTRDSNTFTVSANVGPEEKATFYLTYEELLERKNSQYDLVLNIRPGQVVDHLNVQVYIDESRPLVFVKTPSLRSGNEITTSNDKLDPASFIEIINSTSSLVKFQPDVVKQQEYAKELGGTESKGLAAQFVVQYEVERDPLGGEVLLQNGYFVHFFVPKDAEVIPKHVYFILDTSSSMYGTKLQQLKDAMTSILDEIKPEDSLSIVEFNSEIYVWDIENEKSIIVKWDNYREPFEKLADEIYQQMNGCAMGASISSVIAQLVLEDLEESVMSHLDFNVPFFHRYIDDCICAIPTNKMTEILDKFNSCHPKLKFTIEIEQNNKINFLDITLHRINNTVKTMWFTKEIWSSRYLNYNSHHPFSHKKSKLNLSRPISATNESITKAKKLIDNIQDGGGTHMIGGLDAGLYLVKSEIERTKESDHQRKHLLIFLTDGQPNIGIHSTDEIIDVTKLNKDINAPLYSLAFGNSADIEFLKKLSLKNRAFSRQIYEAADAAIQLQQFYRQISSPLLSDVHFKYNDDASEVTNTGFPIVYAGGEILTRLYIFLGHEFDPTIRAVGKRGPLMYKPSVHKPVNSLERLWAYLTVKETLQKMNVAKNKTEFTKKALELALKYSFVTDLTSLVVVKPNCTQSMCPDTYRYLPRLGTASQPARPGGRRGRTRSRKTKS